MTFRPLSQRDNADPAFDGPYEGVPAWLKHSLDEWLQPFFRSGGYWSEEPLHDLEIALRLDPPLNWQNGPDTASWSVFNRFQSDELFALDTIDWALSRCDPDSHWVGRIQELLVKGGSAWEAHPNGDGSGCQLVRRAIGPVSESIADLRPVSARAHSHLVTAWTKLVGRSPDPSSAYREAIRAVEVVAAPVVTPDDKVATLGKIITAMRDKPSKWTVDLVEATPEQVTEMAAMIWQSQFDRHGTHDEAVPLNVSQEQADAAVHIAIALVRLFAGGHIRTVA
jgi:hypothetical protein